MELSEFHVPEKN